MAFDTQPSLAIPWSPRCLLIGRTFRLPVLNPLADASLELGAFHLLASRWSPRDSAHYHYLQAPDEPGDYDVVAQVGDQTARATIRVRALADFRRSHTYNDVIWPRRWPLGQDWQSTKTRQTFTDFPEIGAVNPALVQWWTDLELAALWDQVPPAELPRAHFVNLHQGCPNCGTAVFRLGGFYPWQRRHRPADYRSTCPSCSAVFPSNDIAANDFTSGPYLDDGFGYFDDAGNIFIFTATYCWEQQHAFVTGIQALTRRLRTGPFDTAIARRLGVMLLRYALEEVYVAAAPQFRYGVTHALEVPWEWGQSDWASFPDPIAALVKKGSLDYSEATPHVGQVLAVAYDTVWPLLRTDRQLIDQAQGIGIPIADASDAINLIEESMAAILQCIIDRGAGANKPSESLGALMVLRALDRPDAGPVLEWLYDDGPDTLRVFTTNNFFPDGTPPEATSDYNGINTDGVFALEHHLRALRSFHPDFYPESRFPSMVSDPRAAKIARVPHEITMGGRTWFQTGDGDAPGSNAIGIRSDWFETSEDRITDGDSATKVPAERANSLVLSEPYLHSLLDPRTLSWAAEYTNDPTVREIRDASTSRQPRRIGTTIHDGGGTAILRTGETPERAAVAAIYGDPPWHRHMDLLDVQLVAFERPFLVDLGYPRTWATRYLWEAHWATHNSVWGIVPDTPSGGLIAGHGRLIRQVTTDRMQLLDLAGDRWNWDETEGRWSKPGVAFRRLIGLIETDADGVILLDFAQITGGSEHWRTCRGLEGAFTTSGVTLTPRPGTVADPTARRGQLTNLPHPDYAALAYMDEVEAGLAPPTWRGTWQSRIEPAVHLDLHQVAVDAGCELLTASATSVTGTPEESDYHYRALLWRRSVTSQSESTRVDLLFEPRTGPATLRSATAIPATQGSSTARGVELTTKTGTRLVIYWAPDASSDETTIFANGAELTGSLAVVCEDVVTLAGANMFRWGAHRADAPGARQRGQIVGLDLHACSVEVEGLNDVRTGDRLRINPEGGGHNYAIERVDQMSPHRVRLTLDMTSLLGRGAVHSWNGNTIELSTRVIARTGQLHGKRLVVEETGAWATVVEAANRTDDSTTVTVVWNGERATRASGNRVASGQWVSIVDYMNGDTVEFEPVRTFGNESTG